MMKWKISPVFSQFLLHFLFRRFRSGYFYTQTFVKWISASTRFSFSVLMTRSIIVRLEIGANSTCSTDCNCQCMKLFSDHKSPAMLAKPQEQRALALPSEQDWCALSNVKCILDCPCPSPLSETRHCKTRTEHSSTHHHVPIQITSAFIHPLNRLSSPSNSEIIYGAIAQSPLSSPCCHSHDSIDSLFLFRTMCSPCDLCYPIYSQLNHLHLVVLKSSLTSNEWEMKIDKK